MSESFFTTFTTYPTTLYHISRMGIQDKNGLSFKSQYDGPILITEQQEDYRDFGNGFYTGITPDITKGYAIEEDTPVFYRLHCNWEAIPTEKIWQLTEEEWLRLVLCQYPVGSEIKKLPSTKELFTKLSNTEVLIAPVVDAAKSFAIHLFLHNRLSYAGLQSFLKKNPGPMQIIFRTNQACQCLTLKSGRVLSAEEKEETIASRIQECETQIQQVLDIQKKKTGCTYTKWLQKLQKSDQEKERETKIARRKKSLLSEGCPKGLSQEDNKNKNQKGI